MAQVKKPSRLQKMIEKAKLAATFIEVTRTDASGGIVASAAVVIKKGASPLSRTRSLNKLRRIVDEK